MPILGGCLCFDLPTGCKIIGVLYLIGSIFNTLTLLIINCLVWLLDFAATFAALAADQMKDDSTELKFGDTTIDTGSIGFGNDRNDEAAEAVKKGTFAVKIVFLCLLILAILAIVTSSCLIHGVKRQRRGLLLPWMMHECLHMLINLSIIITIFVFLGAIKHAWILASPFFGTFFIGLFFFTVVLSQFQALGMLQLHDDMMMK